MQLDQDWTPFDPGEIDTVAADVSSFFRLNPVEQITGVTATCLVAKESPVADASAASRVGLASFNNAAVTKDGTRPLVLVKVTAPTDAALMGCRYLIRFDFTTDAGNTPSAYGHWYVRALI